MTQTLTPCPNFIGGEWQTPSGATTPVFNLPTGDITAECPVRIAPGLAAVDCNAWCRPLIPAGGGG